MIVYILKSVTCLALLLAFYHLVLEKEKMHTFNRFYLLGSLLFSFLVPAYIIYVDIAPVVLETTETITNFYPNEQLTTAIIVEKPIDYLAIGIGIYCIISSVLLIRFGRNIVCMILKIKQNEKLKYQKAVLVLVDDKILPHTFWNYIFINKNDYKNQKIEQELFTHELTHVTQKHTLDVLLLEFLQAVFWINPFFILLKKAVQLNHEFLADETVINQHKNTTQYQHLLLNKAAWKNDYYLASNLNYSLTKKRLKMMTTQSSQTKIWFKKLAVIPLLAGFIFLFAERVEAQEIIEIKEEPIETIVEDVPFKQDDLSNSEIYKKYYYKNLTIQRKDENGKTISKKYSELNDEEKARLIPPPPLKSKKIIPTKAQFEALKDSKKYAVWIDGKVVKNETLNNYNPTDFASYFNSHVYKNARSERFPQENQAHMQTTAYFNAQNKKRVEKFFDYVKEEHNIIEIIETKENTKVIEIKEQNERENKYIDSPIQNYNVPSSNGSKQSVPSNNSGTITDIRLKLQDVNALKINYINDSIKFHENWFITIDNQKYFYTFDKNERVAKYYKNGKLVNLDIVKEYKKKQQIFQNLKASGKHYVFKTEKEKALIDREFSDLGGMYFRMSRIDKNKVSRPENPVKPYLRLRKNNKVFYKLRKDLTEEDKLLIPPPPPVPNATQEEILKAKKAYEAWKKRTGNDFAPPPPKKEKNQNNDEKKENSFTEKLKKLNEAKKLSEVGKNEIDFRTLNNQSNNEIYVAESPYKVYSFDESTDLTEEQRNELRKDKKYFLDGKEITYNELMKVESKSIKSVNVFSKSVYVLTKTSENSKKHPQKSKKQLPSSFVLPSSFIKKANANKNFVFNSLDAVKKESKLNDFEKKQFLLRKTIIQATTLKKENFNFKVDGKQVDINEVFVYLYKNPLCHINSTFENNGIMMLDLNKPQKKKMSSNDLQRIYTKVFNKIN